MGAKLQEKIATNIETNKRRRYILRYKAKSAQLGDKRTIERSGKAFGVKVY